MSRSLSFDIDEAKALMDEEKCWYRVAQKLGVRSGSIQAALEPLGYKSSRKSGQPRKWDLNKALKLLKKKSVKEVAEIMGISPRTLWKTLKKLKEASA